MPLNVPSYTTGNISFGPGRLFLGAAGTTPSVDVGAITEDGVTLELENEKRHIYQGNPKMIAYTFSQQQGVMVRLGGIEWDFTNFAYAMGSGNTTASGSEDTFAYGGDPLVNQVAMHVQHQMAVLGHTLNAYIWQAVSNQSLVLPLGHDEHQFEYEFTAQRVTTNWAGASLASSEQLVRIERAK